MNTESAQLELSLDAGSGLGADELDRLTGSLRAELLELDVDSVEPVAKQAPPRTGHVLSTRSSWERSSCGSRARPRPFAQSRVPSAPGFG